MGFGPRKRVAVSGVTSAGVERGRGSCKDKVGRVLPGFSIFDGILVWS